MCHVFETIDKYGSRKRLVYSHLRSAMQHFWRFKTLPRLQHDANNLKYFENAARHQQSQIVSIKEQRVQMKVENFSYDGFGGRATGGYASYTAEFKCWTEDPGVAVCSCSDGKERLIPTCYLDGFKMSDYPKQDTENKEFYVGEPCSSDDKKPSCISPEKSLH